MNQIKEYRLMSHNLLVAGSNPAGSTIFLPQNIVALVVFLSTFWFDFG